MEGHCSVKFVERMLNSMRSNFENSTMKSSPSPHYLRYYLKHMEILFIYSYHVSCIGRLDAPNLLFPSVDMQSPLRLKLLEPHSRIGAKEYRDRLGNGEAHVLVDVRPEHHFKIVSLPNSLNVPLGSLEGRLDEIASALKEHSDSSSSSDGVQLYVVCRRGNDSQRAVKYLQEQGFDSAKDIIGGLEGWAHEVDPTFPTY